MATKVTIKQNKVDPDPVSVGRGHKVKWHNESGETVTLELPDIFSPPTNPEIADGATSADYTVNSNATVGDHTYSIVTASAVPRNGTIDVT